MCRRHTRCATSSRGSSPTRRRPRADRAPGRRTRHHHLLGRPACGSARRERDRGLKAELRRIMGVPAGARDIEEIRKPRSNAQAHRRLDLRALEKRIMFRRAMKARDAERHAPGRAGHQDHERGRLNGIEIARTEWYREGAYRLHTAARRHRLRHRRGQDQLWRDRA